MKIRNKKCAAYCLASVFGAAATTFAFEPGSVSSYAMFGAFSLSAIHFGRMALSRVIVVVNLLLCCY